MLFLLLKSSNLLSSLAEAFPKLLCQRSCCSAEAEGYHVCNPSGRHHPGELTPASYWWLRCAQAILRTVLPLACPCGMVSGHTALTLKFEELMLAGRRRRRKQRGRNQQWEPGMVGEERDDWSREEQGNGDRSNNKGLVWVGAEADGVLWGMGKSRTWYPLGVSPPKQKAESRNPCEAGCPWQWGVLGPAAGHCSCSRVLSEYQGFAGFAVWWWRG